MIEVKNFKPADGLWWEVGYREEGWVHLELVGTDTEYYERRNVALNTLVQMWDIPRHTIQKFFEGLRPDLAESRTKVYLKADFREDQVEGLPPIGKRGGKAPAPKKREEKENVVGNG